MSTSAPTPQSLGQRLLAVREARGLTQSFVAKQSGISPSQLSKLEAGRQADTSFAAVAAIAQALGLSLDALTGSGEAFNTALETIHLGDDDWCSDQEKAVARVQAAWEALELDLYGRIRHYLASGDEKLFDTICTDEAKEDVLQALRMTRLRGLDWNPPAQHLTECTVLEADEHGNASLVENEPSPLAILLIGSPTPLQIQIKRSGPGRYLIAGLESSARQGGSTRFKPLLAPRLTPGKASFVVGKMHPLLGDGDILLDNRDLAKHMFISGRTGTGKGVFVEHMVHGIARLQSHACVVIDAHGTLCENISNGLLAEDPDFAERLTILDFSTGSNDRCIVFNPLDVESAADINWVVDALQEALLPMMQAQLAPRALNYFSLAATALSEVNMQLRDAGARQRYNLPAIERFYRDDAFRAHVVALSQHRQVKEMFDPETGPFELLSASQRQEHIAGLRRGLDFLSCSVHASHIFAPLPSSFAWRDLIKPGAVILCRMSRFGHQWKFAAFLSTLLTGTLSASVHQWGLHRDPKTLEWRGAGCRVFLDEAPTFIQRDSLTLTMLAAARKWDLGYIFCAQHPQQYHPDVEATLYANTAHKVAFQTESCPEHFALALDRGHHLLSTSDIERLPKYVAYCNFLFEGQETGPVAISPLGPWDKSHSADQVQAAAQRTETILTKMTECYGVEASAIDQARANTTHLHFALVHKQLESEKERQRQKEQAQQKIAQLRESIADHQTAAQRLSKELETTLAHLPQEFLPEQAGGAGFLDGSQDLWNEDFPWDDTLPGDKAVSDGDG